MGIQFKQGGRSSELVGSRDSVISSIENISRPILRELVIAELEQANVRSSALLAANRGCEKRGRLFKCASKIAIRHVQ